MKTRPPLLWIAAIGFLLLLGPPAMLWLTAPKPDPALPIERFMPARLSAALVLRRPRLAWDRHWNTRPGPAPEDALQAILEAMDTWPRWIKKYGELRSRLRLQLYQGAFFQAFGEETWLVFGDWGGIPRDAGPAGVATVSTGFVAFIRGDTPVTSRVGPLVDLVFGDSGYKLHRTEVEGVPAFEYVDRRLGHRLTCCQVGGWLCISMRRSDAGPLPDIVRQVKALSASDSPPLNQTASALLPAAATSSTLAFGLAPGLFFEQLRQFTEQRGRKFSELSEQSLGVWRRQLEGVERVTLAHTGDSLLDLQLAVEGRRALELTRLLATDLPASGSTALEVPLAPSAAPSRAVPEPAGGAAATDAHELAQIDLALPLARLGASLAGSTWENTLKNFKGLDLFAPGLRAQLERNLINGDPRDRGRIGLAAYSSPLLIPRLLYWVDRLPLAAIRHAPAQVWSAAAPAADRPTSGDLCLWLAAPAATPVPGNAATPARRGAWDAFVDRLWTQQAAFPLAFLTLNFHDVAADLDKIPTLLMKKPQRKSLQRWKSTVQALALGVGGAAARLDAVGNRWILTFRTP